MLLLLLCGGLTGAEKCSALRLSYAAEEIIRCVHIVLAAMAMALVLQ